MTEFLMAQSREGPPVYLEGATNIFDALEIIEAKHNARYVAEREKEHEHQLEPLPTTHSIYKAQEHRRIKEHEENLCLVRACQKFLTWVDRVSFLAAHGYEFDGKATRLYEKLRRRVQNLVDTGEWDRLVEEVEK